MESMFQAFRQLGPARIFSIAALLVGLGVFFVFLTSQLSTADMALLYNELEPDDSLKIAGKLEERGIPYQVKREGTQIYVPREQINKVRLNMAEDGLPTGGSVGYEIFDKTDALNSTNFVQDINHLRALEGEISKTIRSISNVQSARVHLVLPKRELFSREKQDPSASIILKMKGSSRLGQNQVNAITHLVATAVPGLSPHRVSIVDDQGTLLAKAGEDGDGMTASHHQEVRRAQENILARSVEKLLERSLGPEKVRAEVSIEMDFTRHTENSETFDPEQQVTRSVQTVENSTHDSSGGQNKSASVQENIPNAENHQASTGGKSRNESKTDEMTNYEISKTVKTAVNDGGVIKRVSIAVLVDGTYKKETDGTKKYEPRSPEDIQQIEKLVKPAIGYNEKRGDTVQIINMQFATMDDETGTASTEPTYLGLEKEDLIRLAQMIGLILMGIMVVLFVVRPLLNKLMEGVATSSGSLLDQSEDGYLPGPMAGQQQNYGGMLPSPSGGMGLDSAMSDQLLQTQNSTSNLEHMINLQQVEGRVRASSLKKIGEIIDTNPEEAVSIVRNWMYEEKQ